VSLIGVAAPVNYEFAMFRQNGSSFCGLRPMPNALAVFIHVPNAVKGHYRAHASP
jgi:hypothetical protein